MTRDEVKRISDMIAELDELIWPIAEYIDRIRSETTTKEDRVLSGFLNSERVTDRLVHLRRTINQIVFSEEKLAEHAAKLKDFLGANPFVSKPMKKKGGGRANRKTG